uniref:OTU domain-containing protein n=1 Tax=Odontella aurita TaxID=265563 RepID=A0A7S4ILX5_9STRA|mmetsp:Transcript_27040/g.79911  ORF Transcript_27040/g.79911 Transcript_27040/m.79911 type:complete len:289 (+) Transcript_27040:233-1099(+)
MRSLALNFFVACAALAGPRPAEPLSAASNSPTPTLFRHFAFAPNGVCVRPSTFYAKIHDDGNSSSPATTTTQCKEFAMRNVPGEGDCMFLAVALATATSMGLGGNDALLRAIAAETRDVVARVLTGSGNLYIEGKRLVPALDLLLSAARGEGVAPDEYLERLRAGGLQGGLQGGGPELTVLSNVLRRPISIYELDEQDSRGAPSTITNADGGGCDGLADEPVAMRCRIREVGVFGDIFRDPCLAIPDSAVLSGLQPGAYSWHLHILVVDAGAGEKHACALLPQFCGEG